MNEAEALAKVTGSRGARIMREIREADGSLTVEVLAAYGDVGRE